MPGLRRNRLGRRFVMMTALATRPKQRMFAGSPDQVRWARDFTRRALEGCPVADDAVLLTSELATNAIVHTVSGKGGMFTVIVYRANTWVRVEVHDGGSADNPAVPSQADAAESGRGLMVLERLAGRWGHAAGPGGRVVWFELEWQ
jgi:serine/threonine-protein kinase RsbW